jgi:hypothetical protein
LILARWLAIASSGLSPKSSVEPAEPITETGSSGLVDRSSQKLLGSSLWMEIKMSAGFTKPRSLASSRRKMATLCEIDLG